MFQVGNSSLDSASDKKSERLSFSTSAAAFFKRPSKKALRTLQCTAAGAITTVVTPKCSAIKLAAVSSVLSWGWAGVTITQSSRQKLKVHMCLTKVAQSPSVISALSYAYCMHITVHPCIHHVKCTIVNTKQYPSCQTYDCEHQTAVSMSNVQM